MRTALVLLAVAGVTVVLFTYAHWPVRCPACGEPFGTVDEREAHLRTAHHT